MCSIGLYAFQKTGINQTRGERGPVLSLSLCHIWEFLLPDVALLTCETQNFAKLLCDNDWWKTVTEFN